MRLFRFKLIISVHGNEVERMRTLSKRSIKYYLYNKLFNSAVSITGCSKFLVTELNKSFCFIKSNKCFPLYNGVGKEFLTERMNKNKGNYVFCAARFVPIKGIDLIVKVANHKNFTKRLMIAGGDDIELLDLMVPINDKMTLLGSLPHSEIAKYLTQAEITVIPSRCETYGILLAEALCCGSPVVATNVGGIPEVISLAKEKLNQLQKEVFDRWVILVEPNVESIRNGISSILNNNSPIKDYLALAPKFRSQFSWGKRLNQFGRILA
jgi:glycosyltransferase involved in cell wall biosynthesis